MLKKCICGLIFLAFGLTAFAHEYVLLAYKYIVKEGDTLELHLFVADGFNIELERPFQKNITKTFQLITAQGTTDLLLEMRDGALPIVDRKVDFKGLGLIAMERDYAKNMLSNSDFKAYLKEDNIEGIHVDTITKTDQREKYTRYIKCLVQSDPVKNDSLFNQKVGQAFEIVLLDDPYTLNQGDWLEAQVFFQGKPLQNKVITARNRLGNSAALHHYSKTDQDGKCAFKIERGGDWFLHATQMIPCNDDAADWESFWTTFSFSVKPSL